MASPDRVQDVPDATLLACEPAWESESNARFVLLWFDFDGETRKFVIPQADAERLLAGVADCLEALNEDGG